MEVPIICFMDVCVCGGGGGGGGEKKYTIRS